MKTQSGSQPTTPSLLLVLCLSFLFLLPLGATAAATGPVHRPSASSPASSSWATAFPTLRWLRDSAVEAIFGGGSRKNKSSSPRGGGGAVQWAAVQERYRDRVVVRFNITSPAEERGLSDAADHMFLDVWAFTPDYVDVALPRDRLRGALTWLPAGLAEPPFVVVEDVAQKVWATYPHGKRWGEGRVGGRERGGIEEWEERMRRDVASSSVEGVDNMFFQDYQPLSVITSWLRLLEAMFPTHVELVSVGTSYEGRDITGVRLAARDDEDDGASGGRRPSSDRRGKRKTLLVTGGIHAREWISTSTVNYLVWSLTTAYGKDPLITKFLQLFDIVFVPVVNPDGYDYTWSTDRLWRKSRQQTGLRFCLGLDLDHAFGYEWDAARHQTDPCSESYGGKEPFQAVEAARLADWARNETDRNGVQFVGLLDLHSYSQQILFPYSYSCAVDPPNRENLEELAAGLAKAIRLSSSETYAVEPACAGAMARTYNASDAMTRVEAGGGSFLDWFYHEMGAHLSYQIKLRDTGSYGFLLPPENIVPTGEEMYAALKYFADYLLGNNGREKFTTTEGPADAGENQGPDETWRELRRRAQE